MPEKSDRAQYMREYYLANKDRMKAKRKPSVRTSADIAAVARYREKKAILIEIAQMPSGPVWGGNV